VGVGAGEVAGGDEVLGERPLALRDDVDDLVEEEADETDGEAYEQGGLVSGIFYCLGFS